MWHRHAGIHDPADPREVADVFEVPLAHFLDEKNHRIDSRIAQWRERRFYPCPMASLHLGRTAGMLKNLHFVLTTAPEAARRSHGVVLLVLVLVMRRPSPLPVGRAVKIKQERRSPHPAGWQDMPITGSPSQLAFTMWASS